MINQVATSIVEISHLSMLSTLCLALEAAVTTLDSSRVVSSVQIPPDPQPPCLDCWTELLGMMCWPQGGLRTSPFSPHVRAHEVLPLLPATLCLRLLRAPLERPDARRGATSVIWTGAAGEERGGWVVR